MNFYACRIYLRLLILLIITHGVNVRLELFAQGCSQPSNLTSVVMPGGNVQLSWSPIQDALSYQIQYRPSGTISWRNGGTVTTTNQVIPGLSPEQVYQWRVRASCSTYSSIAVFTSGGDTGGNTACSQPSNLDALVVTPESALLSWSAIGGAFYYTVQYRLSTTNTWTTAGSVTGTSIAISNLALHSEYRWRVKASCSVYSSVAIFNTGSSGNGGNTSCSQPSNLEATAISTTSVILSWSEIQEAFNYTLQYRLGLSEAFTVISSISGPSYTLSGLLENTEYQFQVKASCSDFSSLAVFSTGGGSSGSGSTSCSAPSNTNTDAIASHSAQISWEPQGGALNYTVQYRAESVRSYVSAGTFRVAQASITGLTPGTKYVWRVMANCSPWGSDVQFETLPASFQFQQTHNSNLSAISPNPVTNSHFQFSVADEARIRIINSAGQLVFDKWASAGTEQVEVSSLQNGLYILQIIKDKTVVESQKLIIAR